MLVTLAIYFEDLERSRRLLSLKPPRTHKITLQYNLCNQEINQPRLELIKDSNLVRGGSHRRRGLNLCWWMPSQAQTLLTNTNTKAYHLGFDRRLFDWKAVQVLRFQSKLSPRLYLTHHSRSLHWLGAPLMRELGAYGSTSSYQHASLLAGFKATTWALLHTDWMRKQRMGAEGWLDYRPAIFLSWAWSQLAELRFYSIAEGASHASSARTALTFNPLLQPWLIVVDAEEITPQVTALLWHDAFDASNFMLDAFEIWSLEAEGVPRYLLPETVIYWQTRLSLLDMINAPTELWGRARWLVDTENNVLTACTQLWEDYKLTPAFWRFKQVKHQSFTQRGLWLMSMWG